MRIWGDSELSSRLSRLTVLVVEGDQKVRGEMHRTLESRGFRVISAWDADDVLGFLATHHDPIDLAVVDATMIGEGNLLAVLEEKRPGIRIVVTQEHHDQPAGNRYETVVRPFEISTVVDRLIPSEPYQD